MTTGDANDRRRLLSIKLATTLRQMHRRFDQDVTHLGITRAQWTMIAVVAARPGTTQREAAKELDVSEAAAGRTIDRLCADGVLVREPRSDDKRAYTVQLTARGQALVEAISTIAVTHERALFANLDDADLERLAVLLDRLAGNAVTGLDGVAAPGGPTPAGPDG